MATTRVLLLGGHGKVSMHLTPLLLAKSWNVTSVVRNAEHEREVLELGKGQPGQMEVLVESLDDVASTSDAQNVLDRVMPSIVVWCAGAGGKGGPERTKQVDEVAAKHFISSSLATESVKKFLMVSYIASRHGYPPWWDDEDKKAADNVNFNVLPHYFKAKVEADEHFVALAKKRNDQDQSFQAINLRPGTLTDDHPTGKVTLGRTSARGKVTRADVAAVAAALLDSDATRGWYDLLQGEDSVGEAVSKLVKEGFDGVEGEDMETILQR